MTKQSQILEILYLISKETDVKTLVSRSKLNEFQIRNVLYNLKRRGLIKKIKEKPFEVGYKKPPFKRTFYIVNKERLNKVEAVIKKGEEEELGKLG